MKPSELLKKKIDEESKILKNSFRGPSYWAIQNIVRRIDFILPLFHRREGWTEKQVDEFRKFFSFGWAPILKQYYDDINLDVHKAFPLMTDEMISWTDSNISLSGRIQFCKQLLSYERAGLIDITSPRKMFLHSHIHIKSRE